MRDGNQYKLLFLMLGSETFKDVVFLFYSPLSLSLSVYLSVSVCLSVSLYICIYTLCPIKKHTKKLFKNLL